MFLRLASAQTSRGQGFLSLLLLEDYINTSILTIRPSHLYRPQLLRAKLSKNMGGDFVKAERLIFKGKLTFLSKSGSDGF